MTSIPEQDVRSMIAEAYIKSHTLVAGNIDKRTKQWKRLTTMAGQFARTSVGIYKLNKRLKIKQ